MPERYTLTTPAQMVQEHFKFELPDIYTAIYNAAPAKLLPVVTSVAPKGLSYFYWGTIPGWAGNKTISQKLLAVNSEDVFNRSAVKKLLKSQRCIIPADGFYMWKQVSKKSRIPHRVILRDKSMFSMAGLWEEFEDEKDQTHHTFRIIQVPSEPPLSTLGDRMPVILDKEQEKTWLDLATEEEELLSMIKPLPGGKMEYYTVSSRINNPETDDPGLIEKVEPMDQFGNYSLFD